MSLGSSMGLKVVKITVAALAGVAIGVGVAFIPTEPPRPAGDSGTSEREAAEPAPPRDPLLLEAWSPTFRRRAREGRWRELGQELDLLRAEQAEAYDEARLAYLHGRAKLEAGDLDVARARLEEFTEPGDPLRRMALYRLGLLEERAGNPALASERRVALLLDHPESERFREVLDREIEFRQGGADPSESLFDLVERVSSRVSGDALGRELDAMMVTIFSRQDDVESARTLGLRLLQARSSDDAAERIALALDRPGIVSILAAEEKRVLGEALRSHRHFDRAVSLLREAREELPRDRQEIDFAIGRALFFAERFDEALETYLRGAREADEVDREVRFLYHAARAALLLGKDEEALEILDRGAARSRGGRSRSAVLENRARLRIREGDLESARADLARLRREFGADGAYADGTLALASRRVLEDDHAAALADLETIPETRLDRYGRPELLYWKARALEESAPGEAVGLYLDVILDPARSHFAYFARERLERPDLAKAVAERRERATARVDESMAQEDAERARRAAGELLVLGEASQGRALLTAIYRRDEAYREFLDLRPLPWPSFPLEPEADRGRRLLAMGLFDDAAGDLESLYELTDAREALTRSVALSRAGDPLGSIRAAEILVGRAPSDYRFEMFPRLLQEQLYPRPFLDRIGLEAARLGADPRLMLAVMREESRFDARAKSPAAARGLMQFVISTARDVGRPLGLDPLHAGDLYRPEVAVRLGAGYLGHLLDRFDRNRYAAAAAYNAGPNQAALWSRLAPGTSADAYLTHVSFGETKNYIRKVLNSYERYREVWGEEQAERAPRLTAW